jgi:hypothetical protein
MISKIEFFTINELDDDKSRNTGALLSLSISSLYLMLKYIVNLKINENISINL